MDRATDIGDFNFVTPSRLSGLGSLSLDKDATEQSRERTSKILKQLSSTLNDIDPLLKELEERIEKLFARATNQPLATLLRSLLPPTPPTAHPTQPIALSHAAAVEDPSEPADRFVQVSRNLQSDGKATTYSSFKNHSRSRTSSYSHGPRGEQSLAETLFDSKALLGVAALGLAFALFPSSSPVPRSLFGRAWPHLLQIALAFLVHVRRTQDLHSAEPRSNGALYIAAAVVQLFSALRDVRGHSLVSFTSRAVFGPIAPLVGLIKQIIVAIPNFLLKTVLLSGISMLGRVTIFFSIAVAVVVAIGVLIVTAAEHI